MGVLHEPDGESRKVGILFVHAGIQGRHGNTNQYVTYARAFSKMGYHCMRFDPNGMGDGQGVIEQMPIRDFYGSVMTGRYVEDTLDAIQEFRKLGMRKIYLFGLCGGAITSLLTAPFDKELAGLILLSCPVIIDSSKVDFKLRIPGELAKRYLLPYLWKIFVPKYWLRVLTLKTDFKTIAENLHALARDTFFGKRTAIHSEEDNSEVTRPKVNPLFLEAYGAVSESRKILWFFGDDDGFWFDFKSEVYEKQYLRVHDQLEVLKNANHMFTLREWQMQILSVTQTWLENQEGGKPVCT